MIPPETPELDHLVVGCLSLADARPELERRLGVSAQGGGAHQGMGTHNALWGLDGGARGLVYLELIAPDPGQEPPASGVLPFGLHLPETRALIADGPRLLTWMARCGDIEARANDLTGPPRRMTRGDLAWRLSIPPGRVPPHDGALPGLIQWPEGDTPSETMARSGLALVSFLRREDADTGRALATLGLESVLPEGDTGPAALRAVIRGPAGETVLD